MTKHLLPANTEQLRGLRARRYVRVSSETTVTIPIVGRADWLRASRSA